MKRKVSILFLNLILCIKLSAQNNLIYNPGFEDAKSGQSPQCDYCHGCNDQYMHNHIADWKVVRCRNYGCNYHHSFPDWMEFLTCYSQLFTFALPPVNRFIYMDKSPSTTTWQDALQTGLKQNLSASNNYLFRIRYLGVDYKFGGTPSGSPRVRIYLTKFSTHWYANWGNVKLSWAMSPPYGGASFLNWYEGIHMLYGTLHPNSFPLLRNITLGAEEAAFYVDEVELYEQCESPMLIENKKIYIPQAPYKSSNVLKAGYDVGSPQTNGNVTIGFGGNISFKATNEILLESGFDAQNGSEFNAILESCISFTSSFIGEEDTTVTIEDDAVDTLSCPVDTIKIYGLDDDTISFTNFWWDYGNGVTSTDKAAKIFYTQPGEYTVLLAVTDSAGQTDTLSKIYIVPDCSNQRMAGNKANNPSSKINSETTIVPNPNNGTFIITTIGAEQFPVLLQITDVLGKSIHQQQINKSKQEINLEAATKGIYIAKFIQGSTTRTERLVIQ